MKDTAYYHQDPLGSTVMLTDNKGHVEGSFSYDAFGSLYDDQSMPCGHNNREQGGKHSAPLHLYNGKRLDPAVGLYDYGYRDYSPIQMRFTTVDPIKSGINWYAYVNNDPVNFIDPLGLSASDNLNLPVNFTGVAFSDTTLRFAAIVQIETGSGNVTEYKEGIAIDNSDYNVSSFGIVTNVEATINKTYGIIFDATIEDFFGSGSTSSASLALAPFKVVSVSGNLETTASGKLGVSTTGSVGASLPIPGDLGVVLTFNSENTIQTEPEYNSNYSGKTFSSDIKGDYYNQ